MKKAVLFYEFSYQGPFFISDTDINNGYGCRHLNRKKEKKGRQLAVVFVIPVR